MSEDKGTRETIRVASDESGEARLSGEEAPGDDLFGCGDPEDGGLARDSEGER